MSWLIPSWFPILIAVALPFWISAVALVVHQAWESPHRRRRPIGPSAGAWLAVAVRREAPGVAVSVHGQEGMDAFWPGIDAIGLSRGTYDGTGPIARAIAAHELGHAVNMHAHPWMAHLLPSARLVESWCWRGFGASILVCALLGQAGAAVPAALFAVSATAAGLVVLADEWMASYRARTWLRRDIDLSVGDVAVAERSMAHALSVYGSRSVGQLAVVAWLPSLLVQAATLRDVAPEPGIDVLGAWILVCALPFLILRVAQVIHQVLAPEPVASDFRLFSVMQAEAQWESLTGMAIFAVLFALHDHGSGSVFAISAALASIVALGPVSAVGRAVVLLPAILLLGYLRDRTEAEDGALFGDSQPDAAPPALMALYSSPPWYLRASWASDLAWVPMIALLVIELLSRGWWPA